jgi:DNA-binding CsgD family transcriptional regulator
MGPRRGGRIYPYFVCSGRNEKTTDCRMQAIPIQTVERLIREHYKTVEIPPEIRPALRDLVNTQFDEMMATAVPDLAAKTKEAAQIKAEQRTLVDAHLAGAIPVDVLKDKERELQERLEIVQAELTILSEDYTECRRFVDDALYLAGNPVALCDRSNADTRRLANQVFFKKLFIMEDMVGTPPHPEHHVESKLQYPFDILTREDVQQEALKMVAEKGCYTYRSDAGSVAHCFSLTRLGSFRRVLKNLNPRIEELQKRLSSSGSEWQGDAGDWRLKYTRGELAGRTGKEKTPVTPGVSACLAEEYTAGASAAALARKYGMHKSTVWRHLARTGVETGQHFLTKNERLIAEVHALRAAGLTLRRIAAQTGVSRPSVLRLLKSG